MFKKLRFSVIMLLVFSNYHIVAEKIFWTKVSSEEREIQQIMLHIGSIRQRFASMGAALSSPSLHAQTYFYLQNLGTDASLKVLKKLVESGELPKSYLGKV